MALVDRRGLTRQALPAVASSRAAAKKLRRHRVIIESVGQEQKKLKTTVRGWRQERLARELTPGQISFQARPPNGYTFIPAGNPELTTALKEASRDANQQIYAVSASPHAQVHDLSKEVHRIGFHFPTVIVAQVCQQYGITLTSKGEVADDNADTFRQMRQKGGWNNGNTGDKTKDQITVNTEAKNAIKDLFPKIPENDLYTIIKGAFQKGQKKVGTANELTLVRRAQLSVVAHVRHVYTKYDKLLRTVGYREARAQVEKPTLKKLVEWRGDDDNTTDGKQVLEDVFREVIVLSDDEDSDDDADDVVEVVSTRANGWPLPTHQPLETARPLSPRQYEYQSGDENLPGYRVVAHPTRQRRVADATSQTQASTEYRQSRYAAWDRAREEYRANPSTVPTALVPLSPHDPKFYYREPEFNFNDPPTRVRQNPIDIRTPEQSNRYTDRQVVHERLLMEPGLVRGSDGHLYERVYTHPTQASIPQAYVSSRPPSPRHAPLHEGHDSRVQAVSAYILPSIEDNQPPSPVDGRSRALHHDYHIDQPRWSDAHTQANARPRNVQVIDLTDGADAQIAKRRRLEEPLSVRRVIESNDNSRIAGEAATQEVYVRPTRDVQHPRREIIDLSSPIYIRETMPTNSRMVPDSRQSDLRLGGQSIRSDARTFRPLVEVPQNVPTSRRAYGLDPVHDQDLAGGLVSPSRVRREAQMPAERRYAQPPNEKHHLKDPAIREQHVVARNTTRVPVYDNASIPYSREYIPVTRNEVLMSNPPPQQHQPIYVNPSRGSQHDRYERMPPPTYVRN